MTENKTETAPTVTDTTTEEAAKPFQLIPPFSIGKKAKGMAKAAGVDLSGVEEMAPRINEWASSVEERLNIIISTIPNLPAQTIELLKAEAEKQRAEIMQRQQTMPQQPPAQGGDLVSALAQFAPMLFGGGSSDSEFAELGKQALKAQIAMSTAITNAVVSKIVGAAVPAVAAAIVP